MLCREPIASRGAPLSPLLQKELRDLVGGRAFWAALLIAVLLSGYSYIQSVNLYGEASKAAQKSPELARGLSPLDGILVPSFGGLYLISSLLYPFVVIRTLGVEKQTGACQLLLQLPYSLPDLMAAKFAASAAAWLALLCPCLAAMVLWTFQGGHLGGWETANLVLGHFLFALVTAGVSLAAASATESPASASIAAIGVMAGFWVLDFASLGEGGLLKELSALSLTRVLKSFETGLFSLSIVVGSLSAAVGLAALAGVWLRPDWSRSRNIAVSLFTVALAAMAIGASMQICFDRDVAEDRRNSFSPADEALLRKIQGRLMIRVYLASSDPRLYDLERSVLAKLRRTMRHVNVAYEDVVGHRFLSGADDQYGKIVYNYEGREAMSRSTSEDEVLPLVFGLAGLTREPKAAGAAYPGYPLVAASRPAEILFYYVLPAAIACCWACVAGSGCAARNAWWQLGPTASPNQKRRDP